MSPLWDLGAHRAQSARLKLRRPETEKSQPYVGEDEEAIWPPHMFRGAGRPASPEPGGRR